MSGLSDRQVDEIAQRLAARLRGGGGVATITPQAADPRQRWQRGQ